MGSLTGFSIPFHLLDCCWPRCRHGLDRGQCNHLLRWLPMVHVNIGLVVETPPGGPQEQPLQAFEHASSDVPAPA